MADVEVNILRSECLFVYRTQSMETRAFSKFCKKFKLLNLKMQSRNFIEFVQQTMHLLFSFTAILKFLRFTIKSVTLVNMKIHVSRDT